ncbi:MAG: 5'(3')-deoxyribonucleotidase [Saprospiraceae bacterium]|nr:5'(3')-deoxyribonucleotidase [Saprospiraceae bacterium]
MKPRIALDMDEVIADVSPKFLDLYERELGIRLQKEDYWGKKIYQVNGAMHVRDFLHDKGFFADLPVMPGSQEVVKGLMENYDVYITTAAMEFRASLEDKYDWLLRHFPFIHWRNFVFCGDKSILRADYMIDDHVNNLETFTGKGLLYTASHNIDETRFTRVNNWEEIAIFFENEQKAGKVNG